MPSAGATPERRGAAKKIAGVNGCETDKRIAGAATRVTDWMPVFVLYGAPPGITTVNK